MSSRRTPYAGRRGVPPLLVAFAILLIAVVGGAFLLHASGIIRIPALEQDKGSAVAQIDMTGRVNVPISRIAIAAYSDVRREHIYDDRLSRWSEWPLEEKNLPEGAILSQAEILGRVLRREKPQGQMFLETDFFPKGTRPGPSAGVPSGKRAMLLKASAVPGLHGLRQGDRFDIVMTREVEVAEPSAAPSSRKGPKLDLEGPYAGMHEAEMDAPAVEPAPLIVKRSYAEVEVVVENGLLVQPVHEREEVEIAASLLRGATTRRKPVEELIIAVDPDEVTALNRALALNATLQVAVRSGLGDAEEDQGRIPDHLVDPKEIFPDLAAGAPKEGKGAPHFRVVEVIIGGKKRLISIPLGGEAPSPAKDAPEKDVGGQDEDESK